MAEHTYMLTGESHPAALITLPRKRAVAGGVAGCVMAALGVGALGTEAVAALSETSNRAERFVESLEGDLVGTVSASQDFELSFADTESVSTALQDAAEQQCLAEAVYFEARSESLAGQKAIAEVIHNRVESRYYPSTVCGVVYQGAERAQAARRHNCQFSFACDGSTDRWTPSGIAWERAQHIAAISLEGGFMPVTGEATHYHANYVAPSWAKRLKRTAKVGQHQFYQDLPYRRLSAQRRRAAKVASKTASASIDSAAP